MISYAEALTLLKAQAKQCVIDTVTVNLDDTVRHVCAEDIKSPLMIPSFNNAAMDGYAFSSHDTLHASENRPVILSIVSSIAAGDNVTAFEKFHENTACEIMTGALLPPQYDTVLPVEDAAVMIADENNPLQRLVIKKPVSAQNNVRFIGEDFRVNDVIVRQGEKITASHVMALATVGINKIKIFKPLTVAFISTGLEIIDDLSQTLQPGQIYNTNLPYLKLSAKNFSLHVLSFKIQQDDLSEFHRVMTEAEQHKPDLIISIGAVSKGKWDFILQGLTERSANIIFHRVKIKPGKPILFARLPNHGFFFGLPGNPIATVVGWRFFVLPFLRELLKMPGEFAKNVCLKNDGEKKTGFTFFLKAAVTQNSQGMLEADVLPGQESFKIKPLLLAQGFVCFDEAVSRYQAGQMAPFYEGI